MIFFSISLQLFHVVPADLFPNKLCFFILPIPGLVLILRLQQHKGKEFSLGVIFILSACLSLFPQDAESNQSGFGKDIGVSFHHERGKSFHYLQEIY